MASKIIWSEIDEAPALATYAFLPIVQAFTKGRYHQRSGSQFRITQNAFMPLPVKYDVFVDLITDQVQIMFIHDMLQSQ